MFLISLQQVSFYFVASDRFSYLNVCSVHYKIGVTKIHHVVILHMLKIYLPKSQGKFKFKSGKSGKSHGIFAPDMAGNPVCKYNQ